MANAYPIDGVVAENEAVDNIIALGDVRYLCGVCGATESAPPAQWHTTGAPAHYCSGVPRRVLVLDHPQTP